MLQVLVAISQKFCCRKEAWGYAKLIHKKKKEEKKRKSIEKMDKCPYYKNNGYLDARLKKKREMNKMAHVFLQLFLSFKREISFQRT